MKFHYFDAYGGGESVRMLLTKAGVAFEDVRMNREQLNEMKQQPGVLEYGQLPMLELDDGTRLVQSQAILRFVARKHGFEAENALDMYKGEQMLQHFTEDIIQRQLMKVFFMPDGEEKAKAMENVHTNVMPAYLQKVDGWTAGKKWLLGDKFTFYDAGIAGFFVNMVLNEKNPQHEKWKALWDAHAGENLKKYVATFREEFKDYLANRP